MFPGALFTTARIWTQAKFFHRETNKDEVHIYSGILLSHKIEQNNAICNNMNGPGDCQTDTSQSDGGRQIPWVWKLKTGTNELIYKISIGTVTGVCFLYLLFGYQEGKSSGRDKVGDWH